MRTSIIRASSASPTGTSLLCLPAISGSPRSSQVRSPCLLAGTGGAGRTSGLSVTDSGVQQRPSGFGSFVAMRPSAFSETLPDISAAAAAAYTDKVRRIRRNNRASKHLTLCVCQHRCTLRPKQGTTCLTSEDGACGVPCAMTVQDLEGLLAAFAEERRAMGERHAAAEERATQLQAQVRARSLDQRTTPDGPRLQSTPASFACGVNQQGHLSPGARSFSIVVCFHCVRLQVADISLRCNDLAELNQKVAAQMEQQQGQLQLVRVAPRRCAAAMPWVRPRPTTHAACCVLPAGEQGCCRHDGAHHGRRAAQQQRGGLTQRVPAGGAFPSLAGRV